MDRQEHGVYARMFASSSQILMVSFSYFVLLLPKFKVNRNILTVEYFYSLVMLLLLDIQYGSIQRIDCKKKKE